MRDFGGEGRRRDQQRNGYGASKSHSTVIEADAVSENRWSPIHSNSNLPLSVAVVKKVMNGLAAIAGNRSARKISDAVEAAGEARDDVARNEFA